jgi:hypothetical protein
MGKRNTNNKKTWIIKVGFEVLTAVIMKCPVFWNMDNQSFGCNRENMVFVEYGNSEMYRQFPMCSVILNAIRFTEKLQ